MIKNIFFSASVLIYCMDFKNHKRFQHFVFNVLCDVL
jgi:hypothetical protein